MANNYLQQSIFFFKSNLSALISIQLPFIVLLMFLQTSSTIGMADGQDMQKQLMMLTFLDLLFVPIYLAATLFYMQAVIDGRTLTPMQSWLMGVRCWFRLFATFFLSAIATALGLMLMIIPGIYVGVRLSLANAICVLENKGPMDAMKESWGATDGMFWTLFKGLALIYGGLFVVEVILSPLVEPGSLISMLISVVLDFFNVLGVIFSYRVYRAWRDKEPVKDEAVL